MKDHASIHLRLVAGLAALAAIVLPVFWAYAQTTATMYTDGTNFGIGTTGPTSKLQVVGTISATTFVGDGSGLTGLPSGGGWSDGGTNVYTSTTTDNVAIGTTTPASRLTLAGNMSLGTTLPYRTISATNNGMGIEGNVGIGTWSAAGGKLIVMGGNVGIGTTSPISLLNIVRNADNTNDMIELQNISSGASAETGIGFTNDTGDIGWLWTGSSGYSNATNASRLMLQSNSVGIGIGGSGDIRFWSNGASQESMIINLSGNVGIGTTTPVGGLTVMNGNVGIGTWSPTQRLQVVGTVAATAFVGDGSGLTGLPSGGGWSDGGTNVYTSTTTDNVGIGTTTPTAALLVQNAGTQASFRVNSSVLDPTPFIIDANGNVGIGTTAPSQKISFMGQSGDLLDMWVDRYGSSPSALVLSNTSSHEYMFHVPDGSTRTLSFYDVVNSWEAAELIASKTSGSNNNGVLTLKTAGHNKSQLFLNAVGNVGVGTTLVSSNFVVNGGVGIGTLNASTFINTAAPAGGLLVENNVGIGTTTPVAGLAVMKGNVGIGTWSPTQRLQVIGTVAATAFVGDGSGLTGLPSGGGWTDGGTNVYTSTTTDNVAIGTTTPVGKLTVKGGVGIGTITPYSTIAPPANGLIVDGNVGIGTWNAVNGKLIVMGGDVGIGMTSPGTALHVTGNNGTAIQLTLEEENSGEGTGINFVAGGGSIASIYGYSGAGASLVFKSQWDGFSFVDSSGSSTSVRIQNDGNVGIGTTTPVGGTAVMNGNVGIGTWSPGSRVNIVGGNIGIGTTTQYRRIAAPTNGMAIEGNVGIGTWSANSGKLIVMGGNVGVGTTTPVGALTVMNGNVGIGTWSPVNTLQVKGSFTTGAVTLTDAATIATDASLGNIFRVTLGGNRTLGNPTNAVDGQRVTWELIQDGSGSRTISLDTKFALGTDISSVTLTTTASKRDFLGAIYNAAQDKWYVVSFVKGY